MTATRKGVMGTSHCDECCTPGVCSVAGCPHAPSLAETLVDMQWIDDILRLRLAKDEYRRIISMITALAHRHAATSFSLSEANDMLLSRAERAERDSAAMMQDRNELRALHDQRAHDLASLMMDANRYRFLRSPLAAESGPVQRELWQEMGVKLCREEAMDREVDAAMRMLAARKAAP